MISNKGGDDMENDFGNGIGDRIKKIRARQGLTQEEFGKKIGSARNTIANYESENRMPGNAVIALICKEFNINEDWLRTGIGGDDNMSIQEDIKYFQNIGKLGNEKNEFKKFYLNMLIGLPDEYWDYVYNEFKKFDKKRGK